MESMFVWIVIFAGAAIALLAVFLVASEKELKKKRLEIDHLLTKLGDTPAQIAGSTTAAMMPVADGEELDRLRVRNRELEIELASVSSKLDSGVNANEELELAQRNVEIAKSNAQWLQTTNDELKAEIEELTARVQASAARIHDPTTPSQSTSDRQRELEREVADLQQQLAESRSKARALDGMEQKLANVDAIQTNHREEKQGFEAKIAELEKVLSASTEKLGQIESLRQQLAESERIQQIMRDERRGADQELVRWQAKAKETEEQSRRLSALQEPFNKLLAKQAAMEERQREYHEAMAGFAQLIARSNNGSPQAAGFNEFQAAAPHAETRRAAMENTSLEADAAAVSPAQVIGAAQMAPKPKRRFGLFPALIVLALGGAMAAGLWSMKASENTAPASVTASALPAPTRNKAPAPPVIATDPKPAASEATATPPAPTTKEAASPTAKEKNEPAKAVQIAKVQQPVAGTYEITQSSRVYAAPSELSQTMGDIEPGVRVNVVSSKNGWLEIHSKHGRPPGFIRKEGARLAQN